MILSKRSKEELSPEVFFETMNMRDGAVFNKAFGDMHVQEIKKAIFVEEVMASQTET